MKIVNVFSTSFSLQTLIHTLISREVFSHSELPVNAFLEYVCLSSQAHSSPSTPQTARSRLLPNMAEGRGTSYRCCFSLVRMPRNKSEVFLVPRPHLGTRLVWPILLDIVGIGWVLLASATRGFSGYIKFAYCSSAKGAPVAQLVRASDKYSEGPGFNPQLGPVFSGFLYPLRKLFFF